MQLSETSLRRFRSIYGDESRAGAKVKLGSGLNLFVGSNNVGKSNILRGLGVCLGGSGVEPYCPEFDDLLGKDKPACSLRFRLSRTHEGETALRAVLGNALGTDLNDGDQGSAVELEIDYGFYEDVRMKKARIYPDGDGEPAVELEGVALEKLGEHLNRIMRFLYLRSGESLSNFLSGAFHELLDTVLRDRLDLQLMEANRHRKDYLNALTKDLLRPLGSHARDLVGEMFEGIEAVTIEPFVPPVEDLIAGAKIWIKDSAPTTIQNKGTGVRGAMLMSLLGYLSEHSRQSLVLAIEEPESFLHPEAQRGLCRRLVSLAERSNVTMLVTTHSPFMVHRGVTTRVFGIDKTENGTEVAAPVVGNDSQAKALQRLFGDMVGSGFLDRIQPLSNGVRVILFVEGTTDRSFIRIAAEKAGRSDLLEGVEIRTNHGASQSAMEAIALKQMVEGKIPIIAVFDADEPGRKAAKDLKKFNFGGNEVLTYRKWRNPAPENIPVEAEDMFSQELLEGFLERHGKEMLQESNLFKDGTWHYGFTKEAKDGLFEAYVEEVLDAEGAARWVAMLKHVRKVAKLD